MSRFISAMATVALAGGLVAVTATPAQAAGLTVNSTSDTATPADGACTLREAITNANADADSTGGDCAAGSGADTISFASSVTGIITLGSQLPAATDAAGLTIEGPGASVLTVSGGDVVRLFEVAAGASLELSALTLADGFPAFNDGGALLNRGTATLTDIVATGNRSDFSAGAVENQGALTIVDSTFSDNTSGISGGAIRSRSSGTLTVSHSTFTGNSSLSGGAIESLGTIQVGTSRFDGNSASLRAGAMFFSGVGPATVSETMFVANTTPGRGGAVSVGGLMIPVTIERSSFVGNSAVFAGGAADSDGPLTVIASTFSENGAGAGGAIHGGSDFTRITVRSSTFTDNSATAGAATLERTLGAGTVHGSILAATSDQVNCVGSWVDGGANIDSGASCGFAAPAGAAWGSNVDPLLGPLTDNGGLTATALPLADSPALDAIDPGLLGCPGATAAAEDLATDQRGVTRPQGPKCDIGAVEVVPPPVVYTISPFAKPVTNEPGTTRLKAGDTLPLRFSVTDDEGARITDLDGDDVTIAVLLTTCGTTAVVVDLSVTAGTALWLRSDGGYQFDLKTQKSWAGLCGTVTVSTPNDGERTANLQFSGGGRGRG